MTRLVCISDTHHMHNRISLPPGDILIHAGDIGVESSKQQLVEFAEWIHDQPYKHKVVIPGNHDLVIEQHPMITREILDDVCEFLIDRAVTIEGIKFWGSPWQPYFGDWAWNLPRGKALERVWNWIPDDTDVLITHGPPRGILDRVQHKGHEGCDDLLKRVLEVRPKLHVFGHIHEGYGQIEKDGTLFVNASICTVDYAPTNKPIVIDI